MIFFFLICRNSKIEKCIESSYTVPSSSLFCFFKISHPPITANSCFFLSIVSLSLSRSWLPPFSFLRARSHLQRLWSKIISIENPPSTDSMVQSLTLPPLVWSLHDVLHVTCLSSVCTTSSLPFHPFYFSRPCRLRRSTWIGLVWEHCTVFCVTFWWQDLPKHYIPSSDKLVLALSWV